MDEVSHAYMENYLRLIDSHLERGQVDTIEDVPESYYEVYLPALLNTTQEHLEKVKDSRSIITDPKTYKAPYSMPVIDLASTKAQPLPPENNPELPTTTATTRTETTECNRSYLRYLQLDAVQSSFSMSEPAEAVSKLAAGNPSTVAETRAIHEMPHAFLEESESSVPNYTSSAEIAPSTDVGLPLPTEAVPPVTVPSRLASNVTPQMPVAPPPLHQPLPALLAAPVQQQPPTAPVQPSVPQTVREAYYLFGSTDDW